MRKGETHATGSPPFCISYNQRVMAKMTCLERPTIRKTLEFEQEIGLLESDQGFLSADPDLRRAAYIRFTPYSDTFRKWHEGDGTQSQVCH